MSTLKVDDIQARQSTDDAISLAADSSVSLKHSASAKLTTTATGVSVTGTCTADTFSGSGASLTSIPAANITGTFTSVTDSKGDVRNIPQNQQLSNSNYTLVASDAGKHIGLGGSPGGLTIPTGVFSAGDAVTIINTGTSDQTITCSALTTYLANDTSAKSSLTLKGRGMATFLFYSGTICYGAGAGLE
tara:strand:+ start:85 stop:651 length:567 start_codon:yes stop_codon:yes gene_type:complete